MYYTRSGKWVSHSAIWKVGLDGNKTLTDVINWQEEVLQREDKSHEKWSKERTILSVRKPEVKQELTNTEKTIDLARITVRLPEHALLTVLWNSLLYQMGPYHSRTGHTYMDHTYPNLLTSSLNATLWNHNRIYLKEQQSCCYYRPQEKLKSTSFFPFEICSVLEMKNNAGW